MNPESLIASAAINFGLAFIVLSLFSIFKKQPSNAPIYYARRLAKRHHIHFDQSFNLSRFLPSVSWIPRAFRITEDEVLNINGLDALIIIRLFKFGLGFVFLGGVFLFLPLHNLKGIAVSCSIHFFGVCCIIGLLILLPVNYGGEDEQSRIYHSLDSFTISNVSAGSNR